MYSKGSLKGRDRLCGKTSRSSGQRYTRPMHVASRTKYVLGRDIIKTSTLMIAKCVTTCISHFFSLHGYGTWCIPRSLLVCLVLTLIYKQVFHTG